MPCVTSGVSTGAAAGPITAESDSCVRPKSLLPAQRPRTNSRRPARLRSSARTIQSQAGAELLDDLQTGEQKTAIVQVGENLCAVAESVAIWVERTNRILQ